MKFLQFLNESSYKKEITVDEAKSLLTTHCYNMDFVAPIWRGMKDKADYIKIDGSLGERKSVSSSNGNYYTILVDKFAETDTPLRSKSIICATYHLKAYTNVYGNRYAIFPYNNVNIAATPPNVYDIWDITIDNKISFSNFNKLLSDLGIDDSSYSTIVKGIEDNLATDKSYDLTKLFNAKHDSVDEQLKRMFSQNNLGYKVVKNNDNYLTSGKNELWIGGPCIAIAEKEWSSMKNDGFKLS